MNDRTKYNSIENIKELSVAEKILIVEDIWESILSSKEEIILSDEQKEELDSRVENYNKNTNDVKPWSEVKKNIESHL
ncbi:MAG: addiction module protein [Ignavibacteriae bacterium]|nr:addiction module protein [Ignavibacteriota bacterium]NOG97291.1 addiction module protein [Ignavibacteriota bacterium]